MPPKLISNSGMLRKRSGESAKGRMCVPLCQYYEICIERIGSDYFAVIAEPLTSYFLEDTQTTEAIHEKRRVYEVPTLNLIYRVLFSEASHITCRHFSSCRICHLVLWLGKGGSGHINWPSPTYPFLKSKYSSQTQKIVK